jgi:hypothetical protein
MLNGKLFSSVNIHREARDWHNRVLSNGGRVSKDTLKAVSDFCYRIDAAGIREKFSRLNLICGDNLTAARVPLYRGLSFTGSQYGNSIDTNTNFVDGDYTERGGNGGLNAGGGGTKYLDTGVLPNNNNGFTGINNHMSTYTMSRAYDFNMGVDESVGCCAGNCAFILLYVPQSGSPGQYYMGDNDSGGVFIGQFYTSSANGLFLGCCDTGESGANSNTYRNGASDNDYTQYDMNSNSLNNIGLSITIFGYNHIAIDFNDYSCLSNDTYGTGHISSYSFGPFLTYDQQLSYYNALQIFQTTLGRNK